jgi:hypothetical protein
MKFWSIAFCLAWSLLLGAGCAPKREPDWIRELLWTKEVPEFMLSVSLDHHETLGGEGGPGYLFIEARTRNIRPEAVGIHGARIAYRDTKEYEGAFSVQLMLEAQDGHYLLTEKILGRRWIIDAKESSIKPADVGR